MNPGAKQRGSTPPPYIQSKRSDHIAKREVPRKMDKRAKVALPWREGAELGGVLGVEAGGVEEAVGGDEEGVDDGEDAGVEEEEGAVAGTEEGAEAGVEEGALVVVGAGDGVLEATGGGEGALDGAFVGETTGVDAAVDTSTASFIPNPQCPGTEQM